MRGGRFAVTDSLISTVIISAHVGYPDIVKTITRIWKHLFYHGLNPAWNRHVRMLCMPTIRQKRQTHTSISNTYGISHATLVYYSQRHYGTLQHGTSWDVRDLYTRIHKHICTNEQRSVSAVRLSRAILISTLVTWHAEIRHWTLLLWEVKYEWKINTL